MAQHKSAFKRYLQSEKRREQNRSLKSALATQIKKTRATITAGTAQVNAGDVRDAQKALAHAGSKGVLCKKTASRRISRLMKAAAKKA